MLKACRANIHMAATDGRCRARSVRGTASSEPRRRRTDPVRSRVERGVGRHPQDGRSGHGTRVNGKSTARGTPLANPSIRPSIERSPVRL